MIPQTVQKAADKPSLQWLEDRFAPLYFNLNAPLPAIEQACAWIRERVFTHRVFSFDTETEGEAGSAKRKDATNIRTATLVGGSICWHEKTNPIDPRNEALRGPDARSWEFPSVYFPLAHKLIPAAPPCVIELLRDVITSPDLIQIMHHGVFDAPLVWWRMGWKLVPPFLDTALMAWMWDETQKKSLKGLAEALLGWPSMEFGELGKTPFGSIPPEMAYRYACQDAYLTLLLTHWFKRNTHTAGLSLLGRLEQPIQDLFLDMHYEGWPINLPLVRRYQTACVEIIGKLKEKLKACIGDIKTGAHTKLKAAFRDHLGVVIPNVQAGTLLELRRRYINDGKPEQYRAAYEVAGLIKQLRIFERYEGTYLKSMVNDLWPDGRIHPRFIQWYFEGKGREGGAKTGRSSVQGPAIQTFPNAPLEIPEDLDLSASTMELVEINLRECWAAPDDWTWVKADACQLEMRTSTGVTGEPLLMEAFLHGENIYKTVGKQALRLAGRPVDDIDKKSVEYAAFKQIVLGMSFGAGPDTVHDLLVDADVEITKDEVKELYDFVVEALPCICKQYPEQLKYTLGVQGYCETNYGRRRHFPNYSARDKRQNNQARNFMTGQSPGFDLMKTGMLGVREHLKRDGLRAHLVGQIHDELMVLAPDEEVARVAQILNEELSNPALMDPFPFKVPVACEVFTGKTYGSLRLYDFSQPAAAVPAEPVTVDHKAAYMTLLTDVLPCQKCEFFQAYGWQKIGPQGQLLQAPIDLAWITSNPSEDELREGIPLTGKSGRMLRQEAYLADLPCPPAGKSVILNTLWCASPRSAGITNPSINNCRPNLERLIDLCKPRVIVCLGSIAARGVLRHKEVELPLGWHQLPDGTPVMVTYHPHFLLKSPGFVNPFRGHMLQVGQFLKTGTV